MERSGYMNFVRPANVKAICGVKLKDRKRFDLYFFPLKI